MALQSKRITKSILRYKNENAIGYTTLYSDGVTIYSWPNRTKLSRYN